MSLTWSVIHSPSLSTSETCKWVLSPKPLILRILESFLRKYPATCFCSTDRTHRCRFSWERTRQCVVFSCHGNSIQYHSCDGGPRPRSHDRPHDWLHVWLLCRPHDWSQDRLQDWPKMQRQRAVLHPCDVFLRKTHAVVFFSEKELGSVARPMPPLSKRTNLTLPCLDPFQIHLKN